MSEEKTKLEPLPEGKMERVVELKRRSRASIIRTLEQKVATASLYGMEDVVKALSCCVESIRGNGEVQP